MHNENPDCLFCKIAHHKAAAVIIFENEEVVIFLDTRPLFHGHCLLIPKIHCKTLPDLPTQLTPNFFTKMQELSLVVKKATRSQGTFVAINNTVSQSIPHFHVHVVPRNRGDGLKGFFWPRTTYSNEELIRTGELLKCTWKQLIGNVN